MTSPILNDIDVTGKRVFVRGDLDVPLNEPEDNNSDNYTVQDPSRLEALKPTIDLLFEKGAGQIVVAGHIGRSGEGEPMISTHILLESLEKILGRHIVFKRLDDPIQENENLILLENLRSTKEEEENNLDFAGKLANLADIYVNEAFATSHREHASIVTLPRLIREKGGQIALGLRFEKEIEVLKNILENPRRPLIALTSGIKKDKLMYAREFEKFCDKVLIGGRLPEYVSEEERDLPVNLQEGKLIFAKLTPDKEDITLHSIERFEEEINKAGTIILAGVIGKYEDEGHRQGTQRVFTAIANSSAFKLVGGGDSEAALTLFGLTDKFDWISVGGGAMLEFLVKKSLPGIEALN